MCCDLTSRGDDPSQHSVIRLWLNRFLLCEADYGYRRYCCFRGRE